MGSSWLIGLSHRTASENIRYSPLTPRRLQPTNALKRPRMSSKIALSGRRVLRLVQQQRWADPNRPEGELLMSLYSSLLP